MAKKLKGWKRKMAIVAILCVQAGMIGLIVFWARTYFLWFQSLGG